MVSTSLTQKQETVSNQQTPWMRLGETIRHLLTSWEIYPILILATFSHLLNSDKVMFSDDEAGVFRLAHDAIVHGLVPLTSNRASLGNLNPPLVVYLFMLPAALSASPLWGAVLVESFNAAAILLTYLFVRRYYGRLAGTIAALLYAASIGAWTFSRNIWPQNFLPFFVILFMWMLFRGVIERRKGWFFWAVVLIGVLYQFHGSTLYFLFPLAAATLFARKTIRWRDIGLAALTLLLLFAPYIYWEVQSQFADIQMIFSTTGQHASIDTQALHFYLFFLHPTLGSPYLNIPAFVRDTHIIIPGAQSILETTPLHYLHLFLKGSFYLASLLLVGGIVTTTLQAFSPQDFVTHVAWQKGGFSRWWADFQAAPARQGLVLLLLWQVLPLLLLTRHSIVLFAHYFIFFLPGPFILIALGVVQSIALMKQYQPRWTLFTRNALVTLAAVLILVQLLGFTSNVIDLAMGNFKDHSYIYSNLHDQQNALQAADRLAQQRHIHRIYILTTSSTRQSMEYLAEQIQTPVEINSSYHCVVLPAPEAGPVILLATPPSVAASNLLNQYASMTLASEPSRPAGNPYKLYILTAKAEPTPVAGTFTQNLQLLSPTAQLYRQPSVGQQWLATRWRVQNTNKPAFRTSYDFHFHTQTNGVSPKVDAFDCTLSSTWAGDQIIAFPIASPIGKAVPSQISLQASTYVNSPQIFSIGPLQVFTYHEIKNAEQQLTSAGQKKIITLPVVVFNGG